MARREKRGGKDFWENFIPVEMKALGAFMYAYQELPKYQENIVAGMKRPWPIWDRLIKAVRSFEDAFKAKSAGTANKTWAIAVYKVARQVVTSEANLTDKEIAESKKIYDSIISWDEPKLKEYVKECAKGIESYGFHKVDVVAPMKMEATESAIESSLADAIEEPKERSVDSALGGSVVVTDEPEEEKPDTAKPLGTMLPKRRGRPAKVTA